MEYVHGENPASVALEHSLLEHRVFGVFFEQVGLLDGVEIAEGVTVQEEVFGGEDAGDVVLGELHAQVYLFGLDVDHHEFSRVDQQVELVLELVHLVDFVVQLQNASADSSLR